MVLGKLGGYHIFGYSMNTPRIEENGAQRLPFTLKTKTAYEVPYGHVGRNKLG
jgi:hypothetical protein